MMDRWTVDSIPDQSGRVVIVTGANSGIGFSTAKALSAKGAHVIMACRNEQKAASAKSDILNSFPEAKLEVMKLDLSNLDQVKFFAAAFKKRFSKLDLLINNAGLMAIPYRKTDDGFEMQFGVNHLGHFSLTAQLFDLIKQSPRSRVVNVSSIAHTQGTMRFDDIHWEKGYNKWRAYGMSKLANLHFTHELADRISIKALDVRVTAAHPGWASTKLLYKGPQMSGSSYMEWTVNMVNRIFAQSSEMGALPTLYAATASEAVHGGFFGPRKMGGMRGYPERVFPKASKISKEDQVKLWELSESLTGVNFMVV